MENQARYKGKGTFSIDRIIDARSNSQLNKVGNGQTGLLNTKTPIVLNQNFETVLADTLKDRMLARGFKMAESAKSASHTMVATVKEFEFTEKTSFTSEVGICKMDVAFQVYDKKKNQTANMTAGAHGEFPGFDVTDTASTALVSCIDLIVIKMIDSGLI